MTREGGALRTPVAEPAASDGRFRELGPADTASAARLAGEAFRGNPFYELVMGLDGAAFHAFWEEFFPLALADRHARVFGLEWGGELVGALVAGFHGFPEPWHGLRFLGRLLGRIGPRRWVRYLRFVAAYTRAMRRPRAEERIEARGLWLMVRADAGRAGLGSRLVRGAADMVLSDGKTLLTGFVDGGENRLRAFYGRLGFTVGPSFPFLGRAAARIERTSGA